jgi:hypothetical protein
MQPHRLTHNAIQRDQRINPPHHHTGASGTSTHQGDVGRGDGNAAVVSPICAPPGNGGGSGNSGGNGGGGTSRRFDSDVAATAEAKTFTDPQGRVIVDAPNNWAMQDASSPDHTITRLNIGIANYECDVVAFANPNLANVPVHQVFRAAQNDAQFTAQYRQETRHCSSISRVVPQVIDTSWCEVSTTMPPAARCVAQSALTARCTRGGGARAARCGNESWQPRDL